MADFDVPLTKSLGQMDEVGLRRGLAFERWFGALNAAEPNQEIVAEASANYALFTGKLREQYAAVRRLLDAYPKNVAGRETIAEIRTLLDQVEPTYQVINARQREVLDLQLAGEHQRANEKVDLLNDVRRQVQNQRALMNSKMEGLTTVAAQATEERQRGVFWLAIAATASTVALGLAVAALITSRLSRPVRSLVRALRDVQLGNLDVQLPVSSTDEVGTLTDSFNFFVKELRSKEQMKQTFGKYIDPRVLQHVLAQPGTEEAVVGGRRDVSVLFADLVGFTSLSERLTPSLMVTLLNRHFGLQALAVQEHHGVVDKFVGDSVMAFWGPPFVKPEEHAVLACRAAQGQLVALDTLGRELPEITGLRRDAPKVRLAIGICTGEAVVGNIGSPTRLNYTALGDTVNLASRLEGVNKIYGTTILLSGPTREAAGEHIFVRELDTVAVYGRSEGVRIFELLAGADDVDLAEPGDEHRDIALPDIVLAAEIGEAGHEVVAMLERHPERAPGLQLACLHLKPPFLHVRQVQKHHPLPRKPSVYRHRLLRRRSAGAA